MLKPMLIVAFLSVNAVVSTAHAEPRLDDFETCWSDASTGYLNRAGISEATLDKSIEVADAACKTLRSEALETNSPEDITEMENYMRTQLYRANPIES